MSRRYGRNQRRNIILCIVTALVLSGCPRRDDTDPPSGMSGMSPFTDHATGCQYLGWGVGAQGKAITPRIAADGKTHMGCKGAKP